MTLKRRIEVLERALLERHTEVDRMRSIIRGLLDLKAEYEAYMQRREHPEWSK